ncbi:MAG: hypothetical protein WBW81_05850 [Methylocella sp.]
MFQNLDLQNDALGQAHIEKSYEDKATLDLAETIAGCISQCGFVSGSEQQPNKLHGFCTDRRAFSRSVLPALAE